MKRFALILLLGLLLPVQLGCRDGSAAPQSLTQVDELILKLLYHPDIQCGMDTAQCEAVIRTLYY